MTEQLAIELGAHSSAPSVPLAFLEPDRITVDEVPVRIVRRYQRVMSRAIWRPSPGRNLSFVIQHEHILLGIAFLSSPVFNLGVRDTFLDLPKDTAAKGSALRQYADMSVCVASQPIGWHWNLGKLIALLAPTLGDYWHAHYGDRLLGVTTTSLWGKGSQYNRIYKFLGYTKGYGHEHVPDDDYMKMRQTVIADPNRRIRAPRELTNGRMKVIEEYARLTGANVSSSTWHGTLRGVYFHASDTRSQQEVIHAWYSRWGWPRYERTKDLDPPYTTGL